MSMQTPYTFISHSSKNREFVLDLVPQFEGEGLALWVDVHDIADGDTWPDAIQRGVEGCAALIVVWSAQSAASKWVKREVLLALRLNKPVFIALMDDTPLPIYLIDLQATDLRTRPNQAVKRLIRALLKQMQTQPTPSQPPAPRLPKPNEHSFFKYLEQLPDGAENARIARSLFEFAEDAANAVTFSGRSEPAFHAHIWIGPGGLQVFSVRAYRRQPAVEVPLQYWANFPPYDEAGERIGILEALNAIMPARDRFALDRADLRPNLPLVRALDADDHRAIFERTIRSAIARLNAAQH